MMWHTGEGMGWWMVFGGIVSLIFWVGIITLVVWSISALVRRGGPGPSGTGRTDPLDIARERYARGEIDRDQFEQIRKDLT